MGGVRAPLSLSLSLTPPIQEGSGNQTTVCVRRTLALFGNTTLAMGEVKSGPVGTGLTGPVATALQRVSNVAFYRVSLQLGWGYSLAWPHQERGVATRD